MEGRLGSLAQVREDFEVRDDRVDPLEVRLREVVIAHLPVAAADEHVQALGAEHASIHRRIIPDHHRALLGELPDGEPVVQGLVLLCSDDDGPFLHGANATLSVEDQARSQHVRAHPVVRQVWLDDVCDPEGHDDGAVERLQELAHARTATDRDAQLPQLFARRAVVAHARHLIVHELVLEACLRLLRRFALLVAGEVHVEIALVLRGLLRREDAAADDIPLPFDRQGVAEVRGEHAPGFDLALERPRVFLDDGEVLRLHIDLGEPCPRFGERCDLPVRDVHDSPPYGPWVALG